MESNVTQNDIPVILQDKNHEIFVYFYIVTSCHQLDNFFFAFCCFRSPVFQICVFNIAWYIVSKCHLPFVCLYETNTFSLKRKPIRQQTQIHQMKLYSGVYDITCADSYGWHQQWKQLYDFIVYNTRVCITFDLKEGKKKKNYTNCTIIPHTYSTSLSSIHVNICVSEIFLYV